MKGELLSYWEKIRIDIPERTYENYPVNQQFKFSMTGGEFGYSKEGTSEQFQTYLKHHKEKFDVFINNLSIMFKDQVNTIKSKNFFLK